MFINVIHPNVNPNKLLKQITSFLNKMYVAFFFYIIIKSFQKITKTHVPRKKKKLTQVSIIVDS